MEHFAGSLANANWQTLLQLTLRFRTHARTWKAADVTRVQYRGSDILCLYADVIS